jgi:hypothetical protein
MSTFNELIDFTRSTTGTYLDSVVYGAELVVNNAFNDATGWYEPRNSSTISAVSNKLRSTADTGSTFGSATTLAGLTVGKQYKIQGTASSNNSSATVRIRVAIPQDLGAGTYITIGETLGSVTFNANFIAIAETMYVGTIVTGHSGGDYVEFDSGFSVKEVTGGQVSGTPLLRTAAINEPRLEYDASGNPLGLLIEEARTNLLEYSEDFTTGWGAINIVATPNIIASPDGAVSGAKLQEDSSGTGGPRVYPAYYVLTANQAQTFSCFFKAGTSNYAYVTIRHSNQNIAGAEFDLANGTVNSTQDNGNMTINGSDITSVGNGWYRCSVTATCSVSTISGLYLMGISDGTGILNGGYPLYALTGKNIYAWGAQVELGSFPTSYIPTSGSTVTRAVDSAVATLSNFYYRQKNGSMFVEFTSKYDESAALFNRVYELGNAGTSINRIMTYVKTDETRLSCSVWDNNVFQAGTTLTTSVPNGTGVYSKAAYAWETNNARAALDGNLVGSVDTSVSLTQTRDTLGIMRGADSTSQTLTGYIKSIQYYPLRLADARLETLT